VVGHHPCHISQTWKRVNREWGLVTELNLFEVDIGYFQISKLSVDILFVINLYYLPT